MLYVIYAEDIADSLEKRTSVRPAHLARLQLLHDEGRLLTAGPMPAVDSNEPGAAGFTAASLRTLRVAAPVLDRVRVAAVSGFVEAMDVQRGSVRLLLRPDTIEGLPAGAIPARVRIVAQGRPGSEPAR